MAAAKMAAIKAAAMAISKSGENSIIA